MSEPFTCARCKKAVVDEHDGLCLGVHTHERAASQPADDDEDDPVEAAVETDPADAIGLLRSFLRHRAHVAEAVGLIRSELARRATVHDLSKLLDDEFGGFSRINAAARVHKFGSPEYHAGIDAERHAVDLHYLRNSHHPERPKLVGEEAERQRGLPDDFTYWQAHGAATMTFLDVIEMVCDWWAARKGYDDPRPWAESVELNLSRKGQFLNPEQLWLVREVAAFFGPLHQTAAADQAP